ncbi:MAG: hypothetical protein H6Q25_1094 [Bacteroidetes bacterium]|nr:hypothetical protein [Bacteroidota bacterium]
MKNLITFSLVLFLNIGYTFAHSGDTITVPQGSIPIINGIINSGEWSDASSIEIPSINGTVYFKHSDTKLYVAFISDSYYFQSTGIYIDKLNNGESTPTNDDVWLHGSAGQYEWSGNGSSWQSSTPSDWSYVANSANEFEISFSKLGITANTNVTLGVLFSFLDWSNGSEITWPNGGYTICGTPNAWADMHISLSTEVIENTEMENEIIVFPNPSHDKIDITGLKNSKIEIVNAQGQIMNTLNTSNSTITIDISKLSVGVYTIIIQSDNKKIVKKIIKM